MMVIVLHSDLIAPHGTACLARDAGTDASSSHSLMSVPKMLWLDAIPPAAY